MENTDIDTDFDNDVAQSPVIVEREKRLMSSESKESNCPVAKKVLFG